MIAQEIVARPVGEVHFADVRSVLPPALGAGGLSPGARDWTRASFDPRAVARARTPVEAISQSEIGAQVGARTPRIAPFAATAI